MPQLNLRQTAVFMKILYFLAQCVKYFSFILTIKISNNTNRLQETLINNAPHYVRYALWLLLINAFNERLVLGCRLRDKKPKKEAISYETAPSLSPLMVTYSRSVCCRNKTTHACPSSYCNTAYNVYSSFFCVPYWIIFKGTNS